MTIVVALAAGALASLVLQRGLADVFRHPALLRTNYRGRSLPTASGLVLVVAVIVVEGLRVLVDLLRSSPSPAPASVLVLGAVTGFGLLGLADDLLGDDRDKGMRGHLRALGEGRISTGLVKLVGGGALALVLVGAAGGRGPGQVVVDAAVVALAANLANLFDRAPGRTIKVALVAYVPLAVVAGAGPVGVSLAIAVGAAAGLLPADLAERSMVGDAGANALGAALGLGLVLTAGTGARVTALLILLALTATSEVVSFSRVIARTPPLRALDDLGRRREERSR